MATKNPRYRSDAELALAAKYVVERAEAHKPGVQVGVNERGDVTVRNANTPAAHAMPAPWLVGVFLADCPRVVIFDALRERCNEIGATA